MKGNFESIIKGEKPVFVDFYAEWCGPCKIQSPILKELATELGEKIRVIKIDVDKNPEISVRYHIQSVPTLMLFRNGTVLWRQSGVTDKSHLYNVIKTHISSGL
jgi:thioredoxin 1